tara:strand:- start:4587 stop:4850 length:264 start_codon:yes stop_codon:yes gene_type:complete
MNLPRDAFTCGPFASSSVNAQNFAYSLYYSQLFQESIDTQIKMENELNLAIERGETEEEICHKQRQIDYLESLFNLSMTISLDDELQ